MAALNAGRQLSRTLQLKAHDLLVATNRETSGDAYRRLREAFERLAGTRITTNIVTGAQETTTGFGLIESWEIVRKTPRNAKGGGRMVSVSVTLSDWLYRAVLSKSVLTLSRDYFRLRKPLERRIYELARKHCGRQEGWTVSVETLLKKSGSASPRRVFRRMLRDMIAADHLPDYIMEEQPGDLIRFSPRAHMIEAPATPPRLSEAARERAREMMPGWDVYALEADWRAVWARSGAPRLRSPTRLFSAGRGNGPRGNRPARAPAPGRTLQVERSEHPGAAEHTEEVADNVGDGQRVVDRRFGGHHQVARVDREVARREEARRPRSGRW